MASDEAFQANAFQPYAFQEGIYPPNYMLHSTMGPTNVVAGIINRRLRGWTLGPPIAVFPDETFNPRLQPPAPSVPRPMRANPVIGH